MAYSKTRNLSKLLGSGNTGAIPQTSISSEVSFGVNSYNNISALPLSGNSVGDQAFVDSDNRLYIWNGTGWYNIALINTNPSITGGYVSSYKFETNGTPIEITLIGSDPEGIPLTWSYEVTSGSLTNGGGTTATINQVGNVFTLTPTTNIDYGGSFSITWKASDGVNLGTAVSSFTLLFTIINSKYTTFLLKSSTTGNNTTFVDNSTVGRTFTPSGDVVQESFSPHSRQQGEWSVYFDGTGDYLTIPYTTSLMDWWSTDFTLECWVFPKTLTGAYYVVGGSNIPTLISNGDPAANTNYWSFGPVSDGTVRLFYYNGAVVFPATSTETVKLNQWNHIAVIKDSNGFKYFVNGVGSNYIAISGTPQSNATYPLVIGQVYNTSFNGYVSNVRLVKGSALYTANFTVPTVPLVPVTNTSLLTCQDRNFKDNSSNDFAITTAGNASISAFGPFDVSDVYDKAVHGGSGYFDGAGDFLNMSSNVDIATGPFSIEAWIYVNSLSSQQDILSNRYWQTGNNGGYELSILTTGIIKLEASPGTWNSWPTIISSTTAIKANEWNHIAICRDSSDVITFYLNGVADSTVTYSASLNLGDPHTTRVGYVIIDGTSYNYYNGYMSDLRVVIGSTPYTANFTPPTSALTAITNTAFLLNFNNVNIFDGSRQKGVMRLFGNTTPSATQTKYSATSVYFDGTGDAIYHAESSPEFGFGTGDFTIEFWLYYTGGTGYVFFLVTNSGSGNYVGYGLDNGTKRPWVWNNATVLQGSTDITNNVWQHHAVVRSAGVVTIYLNGTSIGSTTWTTDLGSSRPLFIGDNGSGGQNTTGYIEDLRITKGLARYTANFTPPTSELLG